MNEFNFLPPKKVADENVTRENRAVLGRAILILVVVGIVTASIWGYSFYQSIQINALNSKKTELENAIASQQDKIELITKVHRKVAGIKYILSSQFDYGTGFRTYFQLLPGGINAQKVNIDKTGTLKSSVTASSSGALKDFVTELTNPSRSYQEVTFGQIKAGEEEGYTLDIGLVVKANK